MLELRAKFQARSINYEIRTDGSSLGNSNIFVSFSKMRENSNTYTQKTSFFKKKSPEQYIDRQPVPALLLLYLAFITQFVAVISYLGWQ